MWSSKQSDLSDQAREVMDYLEQFSVVNQVVIPIKTDDHLVMVKKLMTLS